MLKFICFEWSIAKLARVCKKKFGVPSKYFSDSDKKNQKKIEETILNRHERTRSPIKGNATFSHMYVSFIRPRII